MGLCCSLFPLVLLKKKKEKKRKEREIKRLFAVCFSSAGTDYTVGTAVCRPGQCHPPALPIFAPDSAKQLQAIPRGAGGSHHLWAPLEPAWGQLHVLCTLSSRDILCLRPHQLRYIPICLALVLGSFCPLQTQGQVALVAVVGLLDTDSIEERDGTRPSVPTVGTATCPQEPGPAKLMT